MASSVGIIPFRLGESADTALNERFFTFYERVASLVFGDPSANLLGRQSLRTIGIRQSSIKNDQAIFELAQQAVQALPEECNQLLIDLANPPRDELPSTAIIAGIVAALSGHWWKADRLRRTVVLMHSPISTSEFSYAAMQTHLRSGEMAVVDRRGSVHGTIAQSFVASDYSAALLEVQENPLTLIQRKLIRRIGHFRHKGGSPFRATKYFFDARDCTNEIGAVLLKLESWSKSKQLLVHAPLSPWLIDAADWFGLKRNGRRAIDITGILRRHGGNELKLEARANVLVPMVDTGRTLQRLDRCLKKLNPRCQPNYISVLSTKGNLDTIGTRSLPLGTESADIRYLMKVKQVEYLKDNEPTCMREHEGSDFSQEPPFLTAYAFWEMVQEVGFTEEQDVPGPRKGLGYVPRFPEMLQNNGPLLASKIRTLLEPMSIDPVLICAEEKGAIALTNCISSFVPCSTIRIPRGIIDKTPLEGGTDTLRDQLSATESKTEWFKRLVSASSKGSSRAILIDEFTSSGGTLTRLSRICASFGLLMERSVVLVDFSARGVSAGVQHDSLYRILLGEFS
jgi:adenine/guanine phosphoribosyltransferase-like PRPP-binding protein